MEYDIHEKKNEQRVTVIKANTNERAIARLLVSSLPAGDVARMENDVFFFLFFQPVSTRISAFRSRTVF